VKVLSKYESSQSIVPGAEVPARIAGLLLSARCARGRSAVAGAGPGAAGFHDVIPLGGGRWGVAVGDVREPAQRNCGRAAADIDVARAVMRAMAQAGFTPSMVLAGTNRALLAAHDPAGPGLAGPGLAGPSLAGPGLAGPGLAGPGLAGPAREACSLTAAYATVRASPVGTRARICVAGPRMAFLRRDGGRLLALGRPGTPLGVRSDPELLDCRVLLRTGDILVLVTAGVIEGLGGAERLCRLLADAGRASAARSTDNILRAVRDAGGGLITHEAVALALKAPGSKRDPGQHSAGWPGRGRYSQDAPPASWGGGRESAVRSQFPF
jgi:hypothetical protein